MTAEAEPVGIVAAAAAAADIVLGGPAVVAVQVGSELELHAEPLCNC